MKWTSLTTALIHNISKMKSIFSVAVTARTRIGCIQFRECGKLLYGRKFSLKMKGWIYQSCVRSAMLYVSETRCQSENEMAILRRTEKATIRAMCRVKLIEKRRSEELIEFSGFIGYFGWTSQGGRSTMVWVF